MDGQVKQANRLSRLVITLMILALIIMTAGSCDTLFGSNSSVATDPILNVQPVAFPTFNSVAASGSMGALQVRSMLEIDPAFTYVNEYNQTMNVQMPNAFLKEIQNRVRAGEDLSQPFTMALSIERDGELDDIEIKATFRRIATAGSTRFIGYYDQTPHPGGGEEPLLNVPFELLFTNNYSLLNAIAGVNSDGGVLIVEFDYNTRSGFYLDNGQGQGLSQDDFYSFESFDLGSGSMTYRAMERHSVTETSNRVVMHLVAGNGIVHFVDFVEGGEDDVRTDYYGVDGTGDAVNEEALTAALAEIDKISNIPRTMWNDRESLVPNFASGEYVALLTAHETNRENNSF